MSLNWDKLRVFHSVAEAGSFTHASTIIHISQSAISRQISALEDQLSVSLFHRHARGLLLTEQGELLLKATKDVYEKLAMIEGQISDTKTEPEGPLKITIAGFLGSAWLSPRIHRFQEQYPKLKLSIFLDNKIYNLSMREADAAIRLYEPSQQELISRKLTSISFHLCASKQYIAKHGMPKSVSDLKKHTLIGYPNGVSLPHEHVNWIFELSNTDKETAPNVFLINSMQAILNTTESGVGISCLPDFMIKHNDNLQIILGQYPSPEAPVYFLYPEERRNSSKIGVFRGFMLKEVSDTPLD